MIRTGLSASIPALPCPGWFRGVALGTACAEVFSWVEALAHAASASTFLPLHKRVFRIPCGFPVPFSQVTCLTAQWEAHSNLTWHQPWFSAVCWWQRRLQVLALHSLVSLMGMVLLGIKVMFFPGHGRTGSPQAGQCIPSLPSQERLWLALSSGSPVTTTSVFLECSNVNLCPGAAKV